MNFIAVVPDPVTGRLVPYVGAADIAIRFAANDQNHANRLARANKLPHAVLIIPDESAPILAAQIRNIAREVDG